MNRRFWALVFLGLAGACTTHAPAALAVDTPLLPYQAPDLTELTGETGEEEEPDDATEESEGAATSEPVPAVPAKAGK